MKKIIIKYSYIFITFFILLLFVNCSGSHYPYDYPIKMMFDRNIRENYKLLPEIPEGWFVLKSDSLPDNIELLLVENNKRAFIAIDSYKISKNAKESIEKKGLKDLALLSFEMKKEKANDELKICSNIEKYNINGNDFIVYDYNSKINSDTARVIIFKKGESYFEIISLQNTQNNKSFKRDSLLIIQYNVLKKILQ